MKVGLGDLPQLPANDQIGGNEMEGERFRALSLAHVNTRIEWLKLAIGD